MQKEYKFGATGINNFAYDVLYILEANHGTKWGRFYFSPLARFINREVTMYVKNMLTYNPGKIAAILEKGGSDDEVVGKLRKLTERPYKAGRTA